MIMIYDMTNISQDALARCDEFVSLHGLNCALVLLSGPSQALLTDVSWLAEAMTGALSLALPSMFSRRAWHVT